MYLSKCNMLYMFYLVTRVYIQFPGKKDWFLHWWWNRCCWKGITAFCIFVGLWKISSVMIPILLDRASAIPTSELSLRKCLINTSFQTYCVKVLSVFRSSMLASLSTCMWSIHIVFDCWRDWLLMAFNHKINAYFLVLDFWEYMLLWFCYQWVKSSVESQSHCKFWT